MNFVCLRKKVLTVAGAVVCCLVAVGAVAQKSAVVDADGSAGWADISNTLGFPLGGIGTGYSAFGQYGFVHVNYDGRARDGVHGQSAGEWEYTADAAKVSAAANLASAQERLSKAKAAGVAEARLARMQGAVDAGAGAGGEGGFACGVCAVDVWVCVARWGDDEGAADECGALAGEGFDF